MTETSAYSLRKRSGLKRTSSFDTDGDETDDDMKSKQSIEDQSKKPFDFQRHFCRGMTTLVLVAIMVGVFQSGHFYCILVGVIIQTEIFRELVNVRYIEAKERNIPAFRTLQWAWFSVAMLSVYGETLHEFFSEHRQLIYLTALTKHSQSITFVLYCIVFAASVLTLKKGLLRFQISQYMWSIVNICIVVFQCKFFAVNTLNGLFWLFFPMACVSMNDVMAYTFGVLFGRKFISAPFWSLSPNKTWEGFIGGGICTILFSFFLPALLAQSTWYTCPTEDLYLIPFPPPLTCVPNPVFTRSFTLSVSLVGSNVNFEVLPIQIHGLAYGLFASVVAPLGGFFASAIKRAYHKKDFESFIPGHGGMMDRMDCQLLMLAFTSVHYSSFIAPTPSLKRLEFLIAALPYDSQVLLLEFLSNLVKVNTGSL